MPFAQKTLSTSKAFTRLSMLIAGAGLAAAAWAAEPAPKDTTATNPLGGKAAAPAAAKATPGQPRQITWEELVPKDWDPAKEFKGMDLSALDDGDPRANELLMKMQEVSNNAPTNPAMNGTEIKIPGFIVPLEEAKGEVTEFLLVPYFGACIHTPPPPANQILHVVPQKGAKFRAMDTVWVTGKLQTLRNDSMMGVSGYHVSAATVTKYTGGSK
ncbi:MULTISPECIES: DUF3299 domain-containing protein [unclassified Variovorax]|uniref:DUF3299 domain-containing protein n=1 Tax=unclassified Variovorax TaxID=663243 RepID=UPI000F7F3D05|nr:MULTISPECIES: DUF3299 domain-containing protein [unclassified Variovorax]RSZ46190.1 DUF3299 domain-containing protein [Variovorax sp. 553]RSZ46355.1 DUF3299 domain-containing protein [Variovorax sp. 679]